MHLMILNGAPDGPGRNIHTTIQDILTAKFFQKGWDVISFQSSQLDIKSCLGCFSCWTKTPGKCVISDDAEKVIKGYVESDVVVLLTPIFWGGFSYELKKALDRLIPILLPFFTMVNRETHHQHRYPSKRLWVVIGTLPEPDQELETIFRNLVQRNIYNILPQSWHVDVFYNQTDKEQIASRLSQIMVIKGVT